MDKQKRANQWKVGVVESGGRTFWQVYRLKSIDGENWKGNREIIGGLYDSPLDAERLARTLNAEEEKI